MAAGGRPAGVTVVGVLAIIIGVLQVIGGVAQLALPGQGVPGWVAVVYIVIGIVTFAVGIGLFRGNTVARAIATVVFVIGLIGDVTTMFLAPAQLWIGIVGALLHIGALALLYSRAANSFFRG